MSLEDFNVKIEFAPNGRPSKVSYWDQEGCGHEHEMSQGELLDDLVGYHLKHMREGHRVTPREGCRYKVILQLGTTLHCTLDEHDHHTPHVFEFPG